MNASPHRRILASAGTGKARHLATQWLALLLRNPEQPPESILATAFTRAAAGEIRERILRRLATAALPGEGGDTERGAIGGLEGGDLPPIPAASCAATLRRVIDRLDRLQIRTLDGFLFDLARRGVFELELPLPLELLDEHGTRTLARAAIDETVEDLGDRDAEALFAVLDALTEGHSGRSVADLVDHSCRDLLALVGEAPASAWEWADEVVGDEPRAVDVAAVAEALDGYADLVERDRSLGDGHLRNALRLDAKRLRTLASIEREHEVPLETWVEVLDKGTTGAVWSKGGAYRGKPLAQDLVDVLVPVVARARWRLAKIAVHRTRAAAGLARALDDRRLTIMARAARVTYDFVTRTVGDHLAAHSHAELFRRLDARIEHLLLDEFQDISRGQWSALRPLASEIAACRDGSRRLIVVGDLKQSIYGWRGGDPEILEHLGDRFDAGRGGVEFAEMHLDLSRRSTQQVLDAVNGVFGSVAWNEVAGRCSEAARAWWGRNFTTHHAYRTEPGVAQLHLVERDDAASGGRISAKVRAVVDLVVELRDRHPEGRVGIVVRRNRTVAELLAALRAHGVPASGWGGGSLRGSAAVNAVLEFLRFCDQPDHTIAAFHVAKSPLGPIVRLQWPSLEDARLRIAARWRRRLASDGFTTVLESLGEGVDVHLSNADRKCWQRLLEFASQFDRTPQFRPSEFVQQAESIRTESFAVVTVLNIHQSRGLEFESVICPDLEFDLNPRTDVLVSKDAAGGPRRIARRMRGLFHLPAFATALDETNAMQVRESLCGLYVAMTRARDRLDLLVDAPEPNTWMIPATAAGLLRSALAPEATEPGVVWRSGEASGDR